VFDDEDMEEWEEGGFKEGFELYNQHIMT